MTDNHNKGGNEAWKQFTISKVAHNQIRRLKVNKGDSQTTRTFHSRKTRFTINKGDSQITKGSHNQPAWLTSIPSDPRPSLGWLRFNQGDLSRWPTVKVTYNQADLHTINQDKTVNYMFVKKKKNSGSPTVTEEKNQEVHNKTKLLITSCHQFVVTQMR